MLAYLSRSTHRVAIANGRLIAFDQQGVPGGEQNCQLEIPRKPRDARAFSNVQRTADWGRIVAKRAISPDLITCLCYRGGSLSQLSAFPGEARSGRCGSAGLPWVSFMQ